VPKDHLLSRIDVFGTAGLERHERAAGASDEAFDVGSAADGQRAHLYAQISAQCIIDR
jgi:hypothetical protein